jgi:membrane-associated phospholipid phosphatase
MVRYLKILMPVEWLLVVFGILIWALYDHFGLGMPGQPGKGANKGPGLFYLQQFLASLDLYALVLSVFVVVRAVHFARLHKFQLRAAPWSAWWIALTDRFVFGQLFQDIRFFHAVLVMFVEFALLKNLIPHVNSTIYDELFLASEKFLCGGVLCSERLVALWGSAQPDVIGQHYRWYYPYMSLAAFTFIAAAPRQLAQEYLFAFAALFLVGVLWVYAVPTLGPVYAVPEAYGFLKDSEIGMLQQELWRWREHLRENPGSRSVLYMISGFPSLHMAVTVLGSVYLGKLHWSLAAASWIFVLLITNSTIYLGWHYVLDDIGSLALVYVCIRLARWCNWKWWGGRDCTG